MLLPSEFITKKKRA